MAYWNGTGRAAVTAHRPYPTATTTTTTTTPVYMLVLLLSTLLIAAIALLVLTFCFSLFYPETEVRIYSCGIAILTACLASGFGLLPLLRVSTPAASEKTLPDTYFLNDSSGGSSENNGTVYFHPLLPPPELTSPVRYVPPILTRPPPEYNVLEANLYFSLSCSSPTEYH